MQSADEMVDLSILSAMVITLVLEAVAQFIRKWILSKLEDSQKLTTDYDRLLKMYEADWLTVDKGESKLVFPIVMEQNLRECQISIDDSKKEYILPPLIEERFGELLRAHEMSDIYNQENVRVNEWKIQDNIFKISTSRTTYYNSLVTNRAMDYRWENGGSVRELLEPGPFLHELKESKLSNHLGFNGFIKSQDGFILFVKRDKKLSIGKSTYGCSVSASLKLKHSLTRERILTEESMYDGICHEIYDELKIPLKHLVETDGRKIHMIAAYRDVIEGGKPQLLFYAESDWDRKKIGENFKSELRKKKRDRSWHFIDGTKLLWIPEKELTGLDIYIDKMKYRRKTYHVVPGVAASIIIFLEGNNKI